MLHKLHSIREMQLDPHQKHTNHEHNMPLDHTVRCLTAVALFSCVHSVFWDLYCAAPDRRETCEHSSEAKAFHDYVSEFNQPTSCVRGAQINTHPPLGRTRSHMLVSTYKHTQSVYQREGTILSVIMLLVLVLTCLVCLLQPYFWMGQTSEIASFQKWSTYECLYILWESLRLPSLNFLKI